MPPRKTDGFDVRFAAGEIQRMARELASSWVIPASRGAVGEQQLKTVLAAAIEDNTLLKERLEREREEIILLRTLLRSALFELHAASGTKTPAQVFAADWYRKRRYLP